MPKTRDVPREAAFGTWLYRLAINVMLARRATLGDPARAPRGESGSARDPSGPAGIERTGDGFRDAIGRLPEGARQIFVLHDVEGYKHEEIAQMLGVTSGTSKAQLHRARMICAAD